MIRFSKRNKQEILQNYKGIKKTDFDFERIVLFFSNTDKSDAHQVIPYRTLQDLDFEELFMYMDRTCSKIGQQYLYYVLRTIPENMNRSLHFEKIIKFLNGHPKIKESTVLDISRLNEPGAYFLQGLFNYKHIDKPKWFWVIPVLSGFSIITLFLSFVFSCPSPFEFSLDKFSVSSAKITRTKDTTKFRLIRTKVQNHLNRLLCCRYYSK